MQSIIPAHGLGNDNLNQAAFVARDPQGRSLQVTADLHTWKAPDGSENVAVVIIPCPNCEHPIAAIPNNKNFSLSNGLSFVAPLRCPGQWATQRGKRNCGNQFYILQGTAHNIRCMAAKGQACGCGALKAGQP